MAKMNFRIEKEHVSGVKAYLKARHGVLYYQVLTNFAGIKNEYHLIKNSKANQYLKYRKTMPHVAFFFDTVEEIEGEISTYLSTCQV
jgi:hypothetical protein